MQDGQHMSFYFLYNVVLENHSVLNSPWGEGVYWQLMVYMLLLMQLKARLTMGIDEFDIFAVIFFRRIAFEKSCMLNLI